MPKTVEQTIKKCKKCKKKTVHLRNNDKTGFVMMLVHIALIFVTAGIWLVLLILGSILNKKIGGWMCQECSN